MPVSTPGSIESAWTRKYRCVIARSVGVSGGTTDPRMTPRTCTRSILLCANSPSTSSPSSSDVRSRSVCSRQLWTSVSPSKTPSTMLVLPASIARSIRTRHHGGRGRHGGASQPRHLTTHNPLDALADVHQQGAIIVDSSRHTRLRTIGRHPRDARAAARRRAAPPVVENNIEAAGEQILEPCRERRERLREQFVSIDGASKLALERCRPIADFGRIRDFSHVDPVAEDDVGGDPTPAPVPRRVPPSHRLEAAAPRTPPIPRPPGADPPDFLVAEFRSVRPFG